MTKKHFIELAKIIAEIPDRETRAKLARDIGALCSRSNSLFNWYKWNSACGLGVDRHSY